VDEAAQIMEDKQIRRIPVVDHDQRLVGVVSLGDLAVHTGDETMAGEVLERVSEPAKPRL
jgi:CBS-domain-containing membrane protein